MGLIFFVHVPTKVNMCRYGGNETAHGERHFLFPHQSDAARAAVPQSKIQISSQAGHQIAPYFFSPLVHGSCTSLFSVIWNIHSLSSEYTTVVQYLDLATCPLLSFPYEMEKSDNNIS
jgi:hypothetical protein